MHRPLASYSTIIESFIFPRDNKESVFPRFNIRWKLGKSGRCRQLRRLMDVRRMELTRKFSPEASCRSYLPRAVLRAINKLYYTPRDVFHESFIGGALRRELRVDTSLLVEFIHKRISLSPRVYETRESCSYYMHNAR